MALVHCELLKVWNENMSEILIRRLCNQDCRDVYDWRNDATTRQMSLNGDVLDYDDHMTWFAMMLSSDINVGLIGEINSEKIGIVHFREDHEVTFVSINLNPSFRGKRLSSEFLSKSLEVYLTKRQSVTQFLAEIKCDNIKSEKIFKDNNFVFLYSHGGVNTFRLMHVRKEGQKDV